MQPQISKHACPLHEIARLYTELVAKFNLVPILFNHLSNRWPRNVKTLGSKLRDLNYWKAFPLLKVNSYKLNSRLRRYHTPHASQFIKTLIKAKCTRLRTWNIAIKISHSCFLSLSFSFKPSLYSLFQFLTKSKSIIHQASVLKRGGLCCIISHQAVRFCTKCCIP